MNLAIPRLGTGALCAALAVALILGAWSLLFPTHAAPADGAGASAAAEAAGMGRPPAARGGSGSDPADASSLGGERKAEPHVAPSAVSAAAPEPRVGGVGLAHGPGMGPRSPLQVPGARSAVTTTAPVNFLAGTYNPAVSLFYLTNQAVNGPARLALLFGPVGAHSVPILGDWDGDGVATVGLYDPELSRFYLRNQNTVGLADAIFDFGETRPITVSQNVRVPIVGDWTGEGYSQVGVYDPVLSRFSLRVGANTMGARARQLIHVDFGQGTAAGAAYEPVVPVTGNWQDSPGDTTKIGLYIPSRGQFHLKLTPPRNGQAGQADRIVNFGIPGRPYQPLAGDWDGDGKATPGLYDPATGTFWLTNSTANGPAPTDHAFRLTDPPLATAPDAVALVAHLPSARALAAEADWPAADLRALVVWLAVVQALWLATLPLALGLFRPLADRGGVFARHLGILLVGYAVWLPGSLGAVRVAPVTIALAAAGLAWLAWGSAARRRETLAWLRTRPALFWWGEVVWLVAFLGMAALRAFTPDIVGSEKPQGFSLLNTMARGMSLPPEDPWLAGYPVNYYYFGYFLAGMLAKLSGVPTNYAFNLGSATTFGLLLSGVFSLGANLVALGRERLRAAGLGHTPRFALPVVGGLLAATMTGLFGNLEGVLEALKRRGWASHEFLAFFDVTQLNAWPDHSDYPWWVRASRVISDYDPTTGQTLPVLGDFPLYSYLVGDMHPHIMGSPYFVAVAALGLAMVAAARCEVSAPPRRGLATALTWLLRHAVEAVIAAILVGALGTLNSWDFPGGVLLLAAACFTHGLLRRTSPAVGAGAAGAAHAPRRPEAAAGPAPAEPASAWADGAGSGPAMLWAAAVAVLLAVGLLVAGTLLYLPFYLVLRPPPLLLLPVPIQTRRAQFALYWGQFLTPVAVLVGVSLVQAGVWHGVLDALADRWRAVRRGVSRPSRALGIRAGGPLLRALGTQQPEGSRGTGTPPASARARRLPAIGLTLLVGAVGVLSFTRFAALAWLLLLAVLSVWAACAATLGRRPAGPAAVAAAEPSGRPLPASGWGPTPGWLYSLTLTAVACLIVAIPEVVFVRDVVGTRLNTVFKLYYQAWPLLACVAAYALVTLSARLLGRPHGEGATGAWPGRRPARDTNQPSQVGTAAPAAGGWRRVAAVAWLGLVGCVLAGGLLYAVPAIAWEGGRTRQPPTLDGMRWLRQEHRGDAAAIDWLRRHITGQPRVLEAKSEVHQAYHGRVASMTGLPTLISWYDRHLHYRGPSPVYAERSDVADRIYRQAGPGSWVALLAQYDVRYVFYGEVERELYGELDAERRARFADALGVAYEGGGVTIFGPPVGPPEARAPLPPNAGG